MLLQCPIRHFVPVKPYPTSFKVFVLASPYDLMLDFKVHKGRMHLLVAAVLGMVATVPTGSHLDFDCYFTSINLMDELLAKGLPATNPPSLESLTTWLVSTSVTTY